MITIFKIIVNIKLLLANKVAHKMHIVLYDIKESVKIYKRVLYRHNYFHDFLRSLNFDIIKIIKYLRNILRLKESII